MRMLMIIMVFSVWIGHLKAQPIQTRSNALFEHQQETSFSKSFEAKNPSELFSQSPSVIPENVGNQFNEGLFTAKEQYHDSQIADLIVRVTGLEVTSNWVKGALWAIGILAVVAVGFLKAFWRGIVKVIMVEATPSQIVKP
jgi:hypothetical protein